MIEALPDIPASVSLPAAFAAADPDGLHDCKILIIDDEEPNVRLLERFLTRSGFDNFISTTDSTEAAALFADFQPDLVLTDWLMPEVDGCAVIEQLRELTSTDDYLPIVVLTADVTPQTRKRALAAGTTDFLTKPFDQVEVLLRIRNLLKARLSHLTIQKQNATLEDCVRGRTIELERALAELRGSQQLVVQQERLAALGAMAGGIAHDFNNSLSVIMGFGELLLHDVEHGLTKEKATLPITTILTAAGDASRIVHRLSEFYRSDDIENHHLPVDLNELVKQAISLTQPRWHTEALAKGRTIKVIREPNRTGCVSGDAAELREVLINLIFNAVDALPEGGTITLGTRAEGGAIVLMISDNGIGMSEDVRRRCLEPFFTTKGKHGTGLGLSMVFGIMQRHAGTIEIKSDPGAGTTFQLRLPLANVLAAAQPAETSWAPAPLRILVVDDQPVLCQVLCEYLQADLHIVETALSGSAALEKFDESQFDLVITDHVMAEMTGEQLAIALKERNPQVPVILLTGYPGVSASGRKYAPAVDLVLGKPLSRSALRVALTKVAVVH